MVDGTDSPDPYVDSGELFHQIELDLYHTAITVLKSTLIGIKHLEDKLQEEANQDDLAVLFCDGLRANAYRMAAVALVTRFQHWIGTLVKDANLTVSRKRTDPSMLVSQLKTLNESQGTGPIPLEFFDELEEVRNSVIHGDSAAEWVSAPGKTRSVAGQFRNAYGEVCISDEQIQDAMAKMIQQVKWYESKLST